ncbi:transmembrane protein yfca [Anaeramoeba flamelloides]|uniref:Transmembrane protein yfca n=1 Tax=Anaeramoeba flamelloides TaxID=1746091 RepID=A0ABQ8XLQ1_9EUKA|nr:transmembrane protein yfca [Anaeramoeba flamelloides]
MNEFQSFLLVLCPICFFTGIGNATLALTHWQILVPLTLSVWKYDLDHIIFISVALDFFSSPLSIVLLRYFFCKKGVKLIIPKFVNTFAVVTIVSSLIGWFLRKYTLEYISKLFGTGISWALLFFFLVFFMKSFCLFKRTKEEKKQEEIFKLNYTSDHEKQELINPNIKDQGDFFLRQSENHPITENTASQSKGSNKSDNSANSALLLNNGDKKHDQKKMILEEELKPWVGDFQKKQFKNTFTFFVVFLIPTFIMGGILGLGPGLFLGLLASSFFGFGPLNASVVANFLMELQMMVLVIGYLVENKANYSFFLPRFFSLLPCSLSGAIIGSIYSVKISKLKVLIVNSFIFFIGYVISVIVYLIKSQ